MNIGSLVTFFKTHPFSDMNRNHVYVGNCYYCHYPRGTDKVFKRQRRCSVEMLKSQMRNKRVPL